MYLSKDNYEFNKIKESGYTIMENTPVLSTTQFANGNRKRIYSNFDDVIITVNFGGLNGTTLKEYIENLTDGLFSYWSVKNKEILSANFIVTLPEVNLLNNLEDGYCTDFEVILEKSSDMVGSI